MWNFISSKEKYQEIVLTVNTSDKILIFVLSDIGKEFDPTQASNADVTLSAKERQIRW